MVSSTYSEQDVSGRCFPKNMVQVPPVIVDSKNGIKEVFSKIHGFKLLKIYDYLIGIDWTWQSIDSISVKSPLGGRKLEIILQIEANWAQKDIF